MEELLGISSFFTRDYIDKHLTKYFSQDTILMKYEFGDEIGKGDSYLSEIYRITFYSKIISTQEIVILKVIVKMLPKSIGCRKTFRSVDFFKNEINFYLYVLPALMNFQSTKKLEDPFTCCPRLFAAHTDGLNDFLILEDVSYNDYKSTTRQEGIDIEHIKTILNCFAKYHALSFAFKDQCIEKFCKLKSYIFETYNDAKYFSWYKNFWRSLCACAIDAVDKEYPNTIYSDKINKFATDETFFKMANAATECGENSIFCHGDSWTPNFLIKYADNKPIDVKMIDFQFCRYASPVLDIFVFLYACIDPELLTEHFDSLLKDYHSKLSSQIKCLGSNPAKVYSWNCFQNDIKKYAFFGVGFCIESTPVLTLDPENAFDMDSIKGSDIHDIADIWIVKPMKKQASRIRLARIIIHAVNKGYI